MNEFSALFRTTHSFMFVKADRMVRCSVLYLCTFENRTEKTRIQGLKGVAQYVIAIKKKKP